MRSSAWLVIIVDLHLILQIALSRPQLVNTRAVELLQKCCAIKVCIYELKQNEQSAFLHLFAWVTIGTKGGLTLYALALSQESIRDYLSL